MAGKKMPTVKRFHHASESNTKPSYILGHSCQAAGILVRGMQSVVCILLIARIHEGVVFPNPCKRMLLDKMVEKLNSSQLGESF